MNTSDYLEVTVGIEPFSPENAEIVEAMVADLPYDSFVIGDKDVKCYIQKDLYDRRALRLVLSRPRLWLSRYRSAIGMRSGRADSSR